MNKRDLSTSVRLNTKVLARLLAFYESQGWQVKHIASFVSALVEELDRLLLANVPAYASHMQMTFDEAVAKLARFRNLKVAPQVRARLLADELAIPTVTKNERLNERRRQRRLQANPPDYTPHVPVSLAQSQPMANLQPAAAGESEVPKEILETAQRIAKQFASPKADIERLKEELRQKLQSQPTSERRKLEVAFKEGDLLVLGTAERPDEHASAVEASREALQGLLKEAVLQRKAIWLLNAATREVALLYKWNEEDGSLQVVASCDRFQASQGDASGVTESGERALTKCPNCGINGLND